VRRERGEGEGKGEEREGKGREKKGEEGLDSAPQSIFLDLPLQN